MITSMTGFGRAVKKAPFGNLIVEVQSVNRKYLEVFVSLPKEFSRFEHEIRRIVGERVLRGQVSVRVHISPNVELAQSTLPDLEAMKSLKKGFEELAGKLGYGKEVIDFPFLMQHAFAGPRVELVEEEDFKPIEVCLVEALQALTEMKAKEGMTLAKDIVERLKKMEAMVKSIEMAAPSSVEKMRQKLKERMEEVLAPSSQLDERLFREAALFAERIDITEEITRFRSHVAQYNELLKGKAKGTGRRMDFLVQEMGREINTIGSKSMDAEIARLVIEVKSELEKIREQIQNIE